MVKKYIVVGAKPVKKFLEGDMESSYGKEVLIIVDRYISIDHVSKLLSDYNVVSTGLLKTYNNDSELLPLDTSARETNSLLNPDNILLSDLTLGINPAIIVTPEYTATIKSLTDTTYHRHPIGKIKQLVERLLCLVE